jgi:uncharacterized protein (TIGR02453 family)
LFNFGKIFDMAYFTSDFNQFFIDLAPNNHKEWFDQNRERYFKSVKQPFEKFMGDLISAVKVYEPSLDMRPGDAIFRINRDIRFAKDKTPYKLNRSGLVGKYGRKEAGHPSLYVELGPERVYLAGGAYMPSSEQLNAIREGIAGDVKGWRKALADASFVKHWGSVHGEENKRLPNEFLTKAAAEEPMLYKKQFYYEAALEPEIITSEALLDTVMAHYAAAQPVHQFIERSLVTG